MILDQLASYATQRVEAAKAHVPLEKIRDLAMDEKKGAFRFEQSLKRPGLSFICEIKKASPSKGVISPDFPYVSIAREYAAGGADCISCLTEPKWFLGSNEIFQEVRRTVFTPMLRKDFTVDEYQLYEAKLLGADAVLLLCSLLDTKTIEKYLSICDSMGISALTEAHDEEEIQSAVSAGARIIGINNRNLKDFSVDTSNAARLRDKIPPNVLAVAESGITSPEDVAAAAQSGADAVLIGEVLMRSQNIAQTLREFRRAACV